MKSMGPGALWIRLTQGTCSRLAIASLLCALAARISSITVFIEKRQSFRKIKCRWTPTTPAERFGRLCPLPGHGYSVIESLAKGTTSLSPSKRPVASRTAGSSISPDPESR